MDRRALNRATLARQFLLARADLSVPTTVEHLVGLQGQAPDAPYVGLWSRLDGFTPDQLAGPLQARELVRTSAMRATVHLMTARDALRVRPLVEPVLERALRSGSPFGKRLVADGVDLAELAEAGERLLASRPHSRRELADALVRTWPDADRDSLSYGVSYLVPSVQVPPRGVWGQSGPPALVSLRSWLGAPTPGTVDDLVLRYLGAFGPATVADIRTWSGLTGLGEVVDRLRPKLWHDGTLLDLPDAPRPGRDTPAPVRFLPEYDNVLLSHADRSRVNPDGRRVPLPPGNGARRGTVFVDGDYRADWRIDSGGVLSVEPFAPLSRAERDDVTAEGLDLLTFVSPEAHHDVVIA
ncbi:winged helix DNA-binding domain-containing protein [Labedaea rhizosphaerae]|uniref:Winged helix DNA-binding protein n=1 Tax=Labedaea rhizosphaerae TaxID=598644 RepID=A0A4R6RXR2_LABRH|nr:winged helix DNA-binding domain-containing protein [Labedaea rhizosphaerae]TDP91145.1 winged helix DNA-binding protein [Labedaea rhizosphaerae]